MKQGINISGGYDHRGKYIVTVTKRRGKLTLEELGDLLRYEESQRWCDHYAILLNCSESTIGGNGLYFDEEENKGDAATLYPIEEGEFCPVCGELTPPFQYCPTCGTSWKDAEKNVETLLASMKAETERSIQSAGSDGARLAWYWTHIGAIDMARQLGLITDDRRRELYAEIEHLKPGKEAQP